MEGAAGGGTGPTVNLEGPPPPEAKAMKNEVGIRLDDRATRAAGGEMYDRGYLEGWEDEVCRSTRLPVRDGCPKAARMSTQVRRVG